MPSNTPKIVIIGAGTTGFGAAWKLRELGFTGWKILERESFAGGLASSYKDAAGYIWDKGGHVIFARNPEYRTFLDEVLGEKINRMDRNAQVWFQGEWIPYPLQKHISKLQNPLRAQIEKEIAHLPPPSGGNFEEYLVSAFGKTLYREFFLPLNSKIWRASLDAMSASWIREKISSPSASDRQSSKEWGINSSFGYPKQGGIGAVFDNASSLIRDRIRFGAEAVSVDTENKEIVFTDGTREAYDWIISTVSIKDMIGMIEDVSSSMTSLAQRLKVNGLVSCGIGLKDRMRDSRSWMYVTDESIPFFRATNLSNYSRNNIPPSEGEDCRSLLLEISCGGGDVSEGIIPEEVFGHLRGMGLAGQDSSMTDISLSYVRDAYPVPTLDRDSILRELQTFLKSRQIISAGRFGAFLYEEGHMDDCFLQGQNAVKEIITK